MTFLQHAGLLSQQCRLDAGRGKLLHPLLFSSKGKSQLGLCLSPRTKIAPGEELVVAVFSFLGIGTCGRWAGAN